MSWDGWVSAYIEYMEHAVNCLCGLIEYNHWILRTSDLVQQSRPRVVHPSSVYVESD